MTDGTAESIFRILDEDGQNVMENFEHLMSLETQEDLLLVLKTFHEESRPLRANNYSGLSLNHLHLKATSEEAKIIIFPEKIQEKSLSCKRLFQEHGEVDDRLNAEEFASGLASFGIKITDDIIDCIFRTLDETGDGWITLEEFEHLTTAMHYMTFNTLFPKRLGNYLSKL